MVVVARMRVPLAPLTRRLSALFFAGALLTGCAAAPGPRLAAARPAGDFEHALRPELLRADQAPPRWSLRKRMAHYGVPGVAVAILRDGKVVHAAGYGVREAGTNDRVDADTLF